MDPAPLIPDYTLLAKAGEGAYGEVYLARSVTGQYRAVKVVYRDRIGSREAFDREFRGAQAYEAVSRKHPGLVDILHVGRDDQNGFFYYVMDAADDIRAGHTLDPLDYRPWTLRAYLQNRTALPVDTCISIGIELASALEFLQQNGLVHRDIKPSNVVIVGGRLKLADIGLVAESREARSIVGTEGYVPPENHGTFAGDVYSLGKLLYEITTGRDSQNFGDAPADEADTEDTRYAGLSRIIDKACAEHYGDRYQSAKALRKALEELAQVTQQAETGLAQPRTTNRSRILILAGVMVLVTVFVVVAVLIGKARLERETALRVAAEQATSARDLMIDKMKENEAKSRKEARNLSNKVMAAVAQSHLEPPRTNASPVDQPPVPTAVTATNPPITSSAPPATNAPAINPMAVKSPAINTSAATVTTSACVEAKTVTAAKPSPYAQIIEGQDVVLNLVCNGGSTIATDLGPYHNNARVISATSKSVGRSRYAYVFDNIPMSGSLHPRDEDYSYLFLGTSVTGFPADDFTISVFFNSLNDGVLIGSGQKELWFREWSLSPAGFSWTWIAGHSSGAKGRTGMVVPINPTFGSWQHVCVTRHGRTVSVYVNGKFQNSNDLFPQDQMPIYSHGLMIGNVKGDSKGYFGKTPRDFTNWRPFKGMIERVLVLSRALSEKEIAVLEKTYRDPNTQSP